MGAEVSVGELFRTVTVELLIAVVPPDVPAGVEKAIIVRALELFGSFVESQVSVKLPLVGVLSLQTLLNDWSNPATFTHKEPARPEIVNIPETVLRGELEIVKLVVWIGVGAVVGVETDA